MYENWDYQTVTNHQKNIKRNAERQKTNEKKNTLTNRYSDGAFPYLIMSN